MKKNTFGAAKLYHPVIYFFFFLTFLFYTFFYIKPDHYAAWKGKAFFSTKTFFASYLTHPGGIVEYLAVFVDQFMANRWSGAILLTFITLGVTLAVHGVLKKLDIKNSLLHFVPAICFITLQANYRFMTDHSLAILIAVLALYFYTALPVGKMLRTLLLTLMTIVLYYLISVPTVIFVLSAVLVEILHKKNYFAILPLVIAALLPLGSALFFAENALNPYLHLLPVDQGYKYPFFKYFVIFAIPFVITLALLWKFPKWMLPTQLGIFLVCGVWLAFTSEDTHFHSMMSIDQLANEQQWQDIINEVKTDGRPSKRLANFQIARALYHTNQLLDNYLIFIHTARSVESFWMVKDVAFTAPMEQSDFCLELGNINEAEHWAHEALSLQGQSLRAIERLVQTSLLRNNYEYATLNYNLLNSSPVGKKIAQRYQPYIEKTVSLKEHAFLNAIQKNSLSADYQILDYKPEHTLTNILEISPKNKMAFDYLMLHYLLNGKLKNLYSSRDEFKKFGYTQYPQMVDEALALFAIGKKASLADLKALGIQLDTLKKFQAYNQIIQKNHGNPAAARQELRQSYKNTYWYYLMFTLVDHIKEKTQES